MINHTGIAAVLMSSARSIIVALCLAAATPAAATEGQDSPSVIGAIELWLVANFDLEPATRSPDLAKVAPARLVEIRYGPASSVSPGAVMGAYDKASHTIYLSETWDGRTPEQLSVLVHEMVHHLQASNETRFACPAERERLAYRAQDEWLRLFGLDLEAAFGINAATVLVATVCTH
ncbi:MAG: DUF6647 family protein [Bauldia litoralis]|uniref:DUF6647 family protein n=2 Tax=Bauldia litoralis TaxID=665467 RepID=UPI003296E158